MKGFRYDGYAYCVCRFGYGNLDSPQNGGVRMAKEIPVLIHTTMVFPQSPEGRMLAEDYERLWEYEFHNSKRTETIGTITIDEWHQKIVEVKI